MSKISLYDALRIAPRPEDFLDRRTGDRGEVFFDENNNTLRLFNGSGPGGVSLAKNDLSNVSDQNFVEKAASAGVGGSSVTASNSPPQDPAPGNLWLNTQSGILFVYYNDGNSSQWIQPATSNVNSLSGINFPNSPTLNQTFVQNNVTWRWNGVSWEIPLPTSLTLTSLNSTDISTTNISVTGNIEGISLSKLSDTNIVSPTAGALLQWSSLQGRWIAGSTTAFNGGTITNPLFINNNSATTNITSGALRVTGGVAVGNNLYVAGTVIIEDETLDLRAGADIRLFNSSNANFVGFTSPETISENKIYVLPTADGTSGQFLRTNGQGVLTWASVSSPSGGTPPGGIDTQVQFNDNGDFGGNVNLTFNSQTQILTVPNLIATAIVNLNNTDQSTSTTSGALRITGGAGIQGQINVGGAINKFTGNTDSTSVTTGTIVVTGGLGVSGSTNVGGTVSTEIPPTNADHLTNKRYVDANILAFSVAFGA